MILVAYKQLIKLFNPKIILGATATPNNKQSKIVNRHYESKFKENEDFTIWLSEQKDNKTIETINEPKANLGNKP